MQQKPAKRGLFYFRNIYYPENILFDMVYCSQNGCVQPKKVVVKMN